MTDPLLNFGLVTDCHYADADPVEGACFRDGIPKLRTAVAELNRHSLAFTLQLGDLVNGNFACFKSVLSVLAELDAPVHHALGNHDFDVAPEMKERVPEVLGLRQSYYRLDAGGFRFLMLDTTMASTYRYPDHSPAHQSAAAELARLQATGDPAAEPYNSGLGSGQLAWLRNELAAATEPVLVFGHHPILPVDEYSLWEAGRVADLFDAHPAVKAYVSGHKHAGAHTERSGVHYLTLRGMLGAPADNAFSVATLFPDRLALSGFGRQESLTIAFR